MFPRLRAEETMLTGFFVVALAVLAKMSMRQRLFSVKSFLVYLARKHCFPHAYAPKKHSGKQCFLVCGGV